MRTSRFVIRRVAFVRAVMSANSSASANINKTFVAMGFLSHLRTCTDHEGDEAGNGTRQAAS